jgi:hypothetical protein
MADINFKAKMIAPNLESDIKKELRAKIKKFWDFKSDIIRVQSAKILYKHIVNHPTYSSLESGILKGELGLTDEVLSNFMDNLESSLDQFFQVKYVGNTGSDDLGGILAYVDSFADNFENLDGSDYHNNSKNEEATKLIQWLKWLTRYGTQEIVFGYRFFERGGRGRSGRGIMIPSKLSGYAYSVNSEFAGTLNDNWFTQSADQARPEIISMILNILREIK